MGVVIDGCPSLLELGVADIQAELDRRRPGQSRLVTQRREGDRAEILSGVLDGKTLGTPIAILVRNEDARESDYDELREKFRPSHADFTYEEKYGIRAWSGGGRASARETIGRVAAGAVAQKLLAARWGVEIVAWVDSTGGITASVDQLSVSKEAVDSSLVRCPDAAVSDQMIELIEGVRKEGDTIGGCVGCVARGVPAGWGEPVFDKLEADLAKGLMSLPACKGFEVGSGFAGTLMRGSEHNDTFRADGDKRVTTPTNWSGGIQGGISNGMPLVMKAAFKPVATIMREQDTVDVRRENTTISGRGRHDACVLPRAVPMVEAMVALVLVDHGLRQDALKGR